jgi:4,5-DOPA dioxygenase extradiol
MATSDELMPALFVGHGNPMNALEVNEYTAAWRGVATRLPQPRAVLVVSAHWYINASAVTAMATPRTIHDFYGFPDELFAFDYPAPGAPDLAQEIADVVRPTWVGLDHDSWGLDHGTWSVLCHLFPAADVPVVQLAVNGMQPLDYHVQLGARLAPLRASGVLVVGSGNVVHNLGAVAPRLGEHGFDWAERFDLAALDLMVDSPGRIAELEDHPDYRLAVPTPDHFLPLLYLAGLADASDTTAVPFVDGRLWGSLSMTAYAVGLDAPAAVAPDVAEPSSLPPDVPPDETNV